MLLPDLSPLWISCKVSLLATLIAVSLGTTSAYRMYRFRLRRQLPTFQNILISLIEGISLIPLVLPPTVIGFILLVMFGKNGWLGQILFQWNLRIIFTWYAAVLAAIVIIFPLIYRAALGSFEQIDTLVMDAARVEGASEVEVFWHIAFPLALPGILGGTVLAFARALGEFGATLMLAGNIPGQTQTMPMAIYFAVEAGNIQEAWFWTIVIIGVSLAGVFAIYRWKLK
ncbi:MAG: molybdate ABC transporter permease subunit [Chamaesiphon sp.]|nr:molybdate ABC transporter permease subunit [Chamaesiphon sp.]